MDIIAQIMADLKAQEVYPERHPVTYSPEQVRKTLTRFLSDLSSITMERSNHETGTQRHSRQS
jgi:hypothetical protein